VSNQRFHIPGFNEGSVKPEWAARLGAAGNQAGASRLTNFVVTADGSLERRPGSTWWGAPKAAAAYAQLLVPYEAGQSRYVIAIQFGNTVGSADTYAEVFESDGTNYGTTAIAWRPGVSIEGVTDLNGILNNTYAASTTKAAMPYKNTQREEIQYFQWEDRLILIHPEHNPVMIRYRDNDHWEVDYMFLEREPPEVFSRRSSTPVFTIGVKGSKNQYPITVSEPLFGHYLEAHAAGLGGAGVKWDGTNEHPLGAIIRLGEHDVTYTTGGQGQLQGRPAFWQIDSVTSPYEAECVPMMNSATGSENYAFSVPTLDEQDFAGPWIYDRTLTSVSAGGPAWDTTAFWNTNSVTFNTGGGSAKLNEDDIGGILVDSNNAGNSPSAYYIRDVDTSTGAVKLLPLSTEHTSQVQSASWYIFRPQLPHMCLTDGTGTFAGGGTDAVWASGADEKVLPPDGHNTKTTDIGWVRPTNIQDDQPCGGAVFFGDGILRLSPGSPPTDKGVERPSRKWATFYQRPCRSAGPINNWGLGPSLATGFPSAGCSHEQRIYFTGFKKSNATLVASEVNEHTHFNQLLHEGATAPLNLQLAFLEGDDPKWMSSGEQLLIGAQSNLYSLKGNPISAASLGFQRVSSRGSGPGLPARLGNEDVWISSDGRDILAAQYDDRVDSTIARSLLAKADHLLDGATITKLITINEPCARLHALTSDGRILVCTQAPEYGTEAWCEYKIESVGTAAIEDMAKVRSPDDNSWQLWMSTNRGNDRAIEFVDYTDTALRMDDRVEGTASTALLTYHPRAISRALAPSYGGIVDGAYAGVQDLTGAGSFGFAVLGLVGAPTTVNLGQTFTATAVLHMPAIAGEAGPTLGGQVNLGRPVLMLVDSIGGAVNGAQVLLAEAGTNPTASTDWVPVAGVGVGPRTRFPQITVTSTTPYQFKVAGVMFEGGGES